MLWVIARSPDLESRMTNVGRSLIQGLLQHKNKGILIAGHILCSAVLRGWRSPAQQHDSMEFYAHLISKIGPTLGEGGWEARRLQEGEGGEHVFVADRGCCTQAILLPLPDGQTHRAQTLLHQWHEQAHRHALTQAPTILVISFSRYGGMQGAAGKNECCLTWDSIVHLPMFTGADDLSSSTVAYSVMAAILHHGQTVTTGHYTARLYEAGGVITCDDNIMPSFQADSSDGEMHRSTEVYALVCHKRGTDCLLGGGSSAVPL